MDHCKMEPKKAHHDDEFKKKLNNRLKRIEGQVRGVQKMIESDVYCDDIINQISAIKSALALSPNPCSKLISILRSGADSILLVWMCWLSSAKLSTDDQKLIQEITMKISILIIIATMLILPVLAQHCGPALPVQGAWKPQSQYSARTQPDNGACRSRALDK